MLAQKGELSAKRASLAVRHAMIEQEVYPLPVRRNAREMAQGCPDNAPEE